ncbi:MAG: DUF3180 domain-containing protein [Propionibacteriaceae bacterium]|nr:DUF3180 domain-containing protein [Propionibacteriaceae bacterium]
MTDGPTIRPTRGGHVLGAALGALVFVGLVLVWWQGQGGTLPVPGAVSWASVLLLAVGMGWLARQTRRTLMRDPGSLDPQQAVTRLLLGKTSQIGGALLGGAYAALLGLSLGGLPAPLAVERVAHGGAAVVLCAAWVWAGHVLEASCRLPDDPEDPDVDSPDTRHGNPAA